MRWLRNNISAILVGLALTIFGAVLGYYISEKQPSVSWTTKTQIILSHENADTSLRVLDSSGSEIKQEVFASEISVWNSGDTLIDELDESSIVREPLTFSLKTLDWLPQTRNAQRPSILSISTVRETTPPPVGLHLEQRGDEIIARWKHLDPGCGFQMLVIFTGTDADYVAAHMSVVGMKSLSYIGGNDMHLKPTLERPLPPFIDPRLGFDWRRVFVAIGALALSSFIGLLSFELSMRWWASEQFYIIQAGLIALMAFFLVFSMSLDIVGLVSTPTIPKQLARIMREGWRM